MHTEKEGKEKPYGAVELKGEFTNNLLNNRIGLLGY